VEVLNDGRGEGLMSFVCISEVLVSHTLRIWCAVEVLNDGRGEGLMSFVCISEVLVSHTLRMCEEGA
jgi:hypothetical protein